MRGCRLEHANALAAVLISLSPVQGQTLAACSAGTAGFVPYLQYALTDDNHLVVTGGFQGLQSRGKLSRPQLRLPVSWGPLQVGIDPVSQVCGGTPRCGSTGQCIGVAAPAAAVSRR